MQWTNHWKRHHRKGASVVKGFHYITWDKSKLQFQIQYMIHCLKLIYRGEMIPCRWLKNEVSLTYTVPKSNTLYLYSKVEWSGCSQTSHFIGVTQAMEYCSIILLSVCHTHLQPVVCNWCSIAGRFTPLNNSMMWGPARNQRLTGGIRGCSTTHHL